MYYIGIDVAKFKHSLAVVGLGGEEIITHFDFANSTEGFSQMLDRLGQAGITYENSRVCIESTGHYGRCLHTHLEGYGFEVCLANALQTARFRKARSIRKVKNDAVDALALAQWLLVENPVATKLSPSEVSELKEIARFRTFHSHIIGDCKRKIICILDQVFPEYASTFSDVFGKASLAVLMRYPNADSLSMSRIDTLTKILHTNSKGKLGKAKAQALKEIAQNSFGTADACQAHSFKLRQLIEQIRFTQNQIESLDKEIAKLLEKAATPITTIPGIGPVCGAIILGEIGNIERFPKSSSLVAYSGLDPSVYESGEFKGNRNKISKRGSKYLRWALWIGADRARMYDPHLREYYEKKRAEGKPHKVAVSAVARKLCRIIFAVLTSDMPYVCPANR